jgi:LuxR family maltose regulon positive regulatory protein
VQALRRAGVAIPGNVGAPVYGRAIYDSFIVRLSAALGAHGPAVFLVLDDLHLVTERRVMEALDRLVRGCPRLHLLACSRSDPLLPLYHYRLAGELTEIRAADLEFRVSEAGTLLKQHGISLTTESQQSLTRRTQGWAAPLRLAAISMQGHRDPEQFVSEIATEDSAVPAYLVGEVLNGQSAEIRDLMMRTSILERVSADIADELTDGKTARTALPALAQANACVEPLGHGWYRYHPLLADVMRLKLRRESPDQVAELQRRAARWLHRHGSYREAVTQAAEAGDWQLAARIVIDELEVVRLMSPRGTDPLAEAIRGIPMGTSWTEPQPWLVQAALGLAEGSLDTAATSLVAAERALGCRPGPHDKPARLAAAIIRLALLSRAGQWRSAADTAQQAQALLNSIPEDLRMRHPELRGQLFTAAGIAELWAGEFDAAAAALAAAAAATENNFQRAGCLEYLALAEALRGKLTRAAQLAAEASAAAEGDPAGGARFPGPAAIDAVFPGPAGVVALAFVHTERNELRDAHLRLKQASTALHVRPDVALAAVASLVAARAFLAEGRARMALDTLGRARGGPPSCRWLGRGLILAQSEALAAIGDPAAAADLARKAGAGQSLDATAAFARASLAAGDGQAARDALAAWPAGFDGAADHLRLDGWLAHSCLAYSSGERACGRQALQQALNLGACEHVRLPFILQRRWIQPVVQDDPELAQACCRLLDPGTVIGSILPPAAVTTGSIHAVPPLSSDLPLVTEKLSGREREVLQCASQLLDTTEIASELYISVNTVKSHFKSIFRKLDATSRNEAVRRARKLHLI